MKILDRVYKEHGFLQDHIFVLEPSDEEIRKLEEEGWIFFAYIQRVDKRKEIHFVRD